MPMILSMGSFVMAAFAVLFLFYTNSFLIRRRNREFGLYNILGMSKRNLAQRARVGDRLMTALVAIVGGLRRWALLLVEARRSWCSSTCVGGSVQMDFPVDSAPAPRR